jgi:hypothetical protein
MIDLQTYSVTDSFFGAPYIDVDEVRNLPISYRRVHGGFEGTDTRFTLSFPEDGYQGRMLQPLAGAHGGVEDLFTTVAGEMMGGFSMCCRLGGYMVESNQGHIGDAIDLKGGEDPTLYGYRASAEVARLSKFIAAQVYGAPPHHSYVFGGSGGGRRSPLCLENAPGIWDGALPFTGGGDIGAPGNTERIQGAQAISFSSMFNVQRVLGAKLADVIDATAPGGSGDPFAGLDSHQREELGSLYRLGYPRGDEAMLAHPMGQLWLWTSTADDLVFQDPAYFTDFWTKPGYIGHDEPALIAEDLMDTRMTVTRVLTIADLLGDEFSTPDYQTMRVLVTFLGATYPRETPFAVQLDQVATGYRLGMGVQIVTGKAAGRQLYCNTFANDVYYCDGPGEANLLRFTDVLVGDEVHLDNRNFLAFCYFARHHLMDTPQFESFRLDGRAIYPQHPVPRQPSTMGTAYSGQYEGKLMWIHHTHDNSLWPPQGALYPNAVRAAQGPDRAEERFRIRWTENAEHGYRSTLPPVGGRATATWLIDFIGIIEQSLVDLVDWVEHDIAPSGTNYAYHDGRVTLPQNADERGGIQPVVAVTANGAPRADIRAGDTVTLEVHAALALGAGKITKVEWDFDGSGSYPVEDSSVDGTASEVKLSTTHRYGRPGTYFATARVTSHRDGDLDAAYRRIPNLGQVRILVT